MKPGHAVLVALVACNGGTETDVTVATDLPCASISNAVVSLIHPNDPPASGAQIVMTCAGGGTFGTGVYHPDSATPNDVVVVAATVDKSDPAACLTTPGAGCIVARKLAPVAYQTNVSILLAQACVGVACDASHTCLNGACVAY